MVKSIYTCVASLVGLYLFCCLFIYQFSEISQPRVIFTVNFNDDIGLHHRSISRNTDPTLESSKTNVAFLKLAKVGSSTLSCIFLRYGFRNNLAMYLPQETGVTKDKQAILLEQNVNVNIFAVHTIYDHHFFTHIVNEPMIFSLMREPERRLISHAFFFLRETPGLKTLPPQEFINEIATNSEKHHAWNKMSVRFGIPKSADKKRTEFNKILARLDKEFDLVLILERFDESLIILKRILHWTIGDILYGVKKSRTATTGKLELDNSSRQVFRQSNWMDYELYDFFSKKLDMKIKEAGKDFNDEISHFKKVMEQTKEFCDESSADTILFPESKWDSSFILSRKTCIDIFELDVGKFKKRNYTVIE